MFLNRQELEQQLLIAATKAGGFSHYHKIENMIKDVIKAADLLCHEQQMRHEEYQKRISAEEQ